MDKEYFEKLFTITKTVERISLEFLSLDLLGCAFMLRLTLTMPDIQSCRLRGQQDCLDSILLHP